MLKLPLDTSTFSELRTSGYLYVDKTQYIYKLITGGRRFFLSRPRRFGKSLLVSTLYEVLTANRSLFKDLWIDQSDYSWKEYGVINLDFSRLIFDDIQTLKNRLGRFFKKIAQQYNISIDIQEDAPDILLEEVVDALHNRFGRVAILIDEYDSPMLKTLYNEDLAKEVRDTIQQFFTIIKSLDKYVQFVFITGVSSFAKAGLFSGINNLQNLTLRNEYGVICGYTDQEIDYYFHDYMTKWAHNKNIDYDELRRQIKHWYNGYRFGENTPAVYNPFSFMNAISVQNFENFWFQSGTPKFLVEVLKKNKHEFDPEDLTIYRDSLGIFDVGKTPILTLMFQAGYLTISNYNKQQQSYTLQYPNEEVRISFQKYLLEVFAHIESTRAAQLFIKFYQAFEQGNIGQVVEILYQLFAYVPYQLYMKQEKYYHSLFIMICVGAGIKAQSEYSTSLGSIDLILEFEQLIYVIEVKFNKSAEEALRQIKNRRYYERFLLQDKSILLLGLSFKREPSSFDIAYVSEKLK